MKQIIILLATALMIAGVATAAPKVEKKFVTTVFVTDLHCEGCAKRVYNNFYGKGVKEVKVDVPTKTVAVTYDESKNTPEGLKSSFADLNIKVIKYMSEAEAQAQKK